MAQGKPWKKEKVIEAVSEYLKLGFSVRRACIIAGVPQSTVQTWIDNEPELRVKVKAWQNMPSAKARKNVVDAIENGDEKQSSWWLERFKLDRADFSEQKLVDHSTKGEKLGSENTEMLSAINAMADTFENNLKQIYAQSNETTEQPLDPRMDTGEQHQDGDGSET